MPVIAKTLIVILSLVAQSAIYTDSLQTQHWINGTPEAPIWKPDPEKEAVYALYEVNPILAGRPEMLKPYFDFWGNIVELTPQYLETPWSIMALTGLSWKAVTTVVKGNEHSKRVGLPQYWGISYRWRF